MEPILPGKYPDIRVGYRYPFFFLYNNIVIKLSAFRDRGVPKPTSECAACPSPDGSSAWASAKGGERGGRRRA
jgi:hypothetical protein